MTAHTTGVARPVPESHLVSAGTPLRPPAPGPIARRAEFLSFSPHTVGEEEIAAVVDVLRSPWITTGPRTRDFEREFSQAVGASGALALNSCTAGLHVALAAWGIGPGDEVITSPLTFTSSVNVIEHVRARPVFVDVDPDTLTLDPTALARAVGPRTRAVIPVHFAGHPAEMDAILDVSGAHGLHVLEDAAHAFPAAYRGRPIGGIGSTAAFSFYATKNLTTAEGGMLTGDAELLERARVLALHGMTRDALRRYEKGGSWFYEVVAPGFKYNMTDVAAALGRTQLGRIAALQARRAAIVAAYQDAFGACDELEVPTARPWVEHAWHLYVLRLRPGALRIDRDRLIDELTARNIGTSVHFIPVHLHPYYRERYGHRPGDFPIAHASYQRSLSLPLTPSLTDADVGDVIAAVLDVVARFRR